MNRYRMLITAAAISFAAASCTLPANHPHYNPTAPKPPTTSYPPTTFTPPATPCHEDDPCWNCATMGNHICGPTQSELQADD